LSKKDAQGTGKYYWIIIIFLLSMMLRLVYSYEISRLPFFTTPIIDAKAYDELAQTIAGGDWIGSESFWQPPLYPYFLAVQYILFGRNMMMVRIVQSLIGSLSVILVFFITINIHSNRAAIIASLLMLSNGVLIYYGGELLITILFVFLALIVVLFLLHFSDSKKWIYLSAAGVILGLSALARPNILVFLPFMIFWLYRLDKNRFRRNSVLFLFSMALIILPVTVRNYVVSKDVIFISYNGGLNFYLGNSSDYNRTVNIRPGLQWDQLIAEARIKGFTRNSEYSNYWYGRGLEFPLNHPMKYTMLILKKMLLLINGYEIMRNMDYNYFRQFSKLLSLPLPGFYLLGITGFMGWGIIFRKNLKTQIISLFVFSQIIAILLFFVTSRYRAPLIPFFCIFSGIWIVYIAEKIRSGNKRKLIINLLIILGLAGLIVPDYFGIHIVDSAGAMLQTGQSYLLKRQYSSAVDCFHQALKIQPDHPDVFFNLGQVNQETNRFKQAIAWFEKVLITFPNDAKTHNNLGLCYFETGKKDKAISHLKTAYRLDPKIIETINNLGNVYAKMGQFKNALEKYKEALVINPELAVVRKNMGEMLLDMGDVDNALIEFTKVVELEPEKYDGYYALGKAYLLKNDFLNASINLETALGKNSGLVSAHGYLAKIYSFNLHEYEKALFHWQRYMRMVPDNPEKLKIEKEILRLQQLLSRNPYRSSK